MVTFSSTLSLSSFLFLSPLLCVAVPQSFNNQPVGQTDAFGFGATGFSGVLGTDLSLTGLPYGSYPTSATGQLEPWYDPNQMSGSHGTPSTQTNGLKPNSKPATQEHKPIPAAKPLPASQPSSSTDRSSASNTQRTPTSGPSSSVNAPEKSSSNPSSPPRAQDSEIERWLQAHNNERMIYGVNNVTWNPDLVAAAHQRASTCYFEHTPNNQYGENIAAGQQSVEEVCNDWANGRNEKDIYDPNGGSGSDTHWTQMVWDTTREIGCCHKTCDQMAGVSLGAGPAKFWVCEYHPAGNVIGQSAEHVHAGPGGKPRTSDSQVPQDSYSSGYTRAPTSNTKPATNSHLGDGNPYGYGFPQRMKRHLKSRWFSQKHKHLA